MVILIVFFYEYYYYIPSEFRLIWCIRHLFNALKCPFFMEIFKLSLTLRYSAVGYNTTLWSDCSWIIWGIRTIWPNSRTLFVITLTEQSHSNDTVNAFPILLRKIGSHPTCFDTSPYTAVCLDRCQGVIRVNKGKLKW